MKKDKIFEILFIKKNNFNNRTNRYNIYKIIAIKFLWLCEYNEPMCILIDIDF